MVSINKKCQVPTPEYMVQLMLDEVGYTSNLYGKKVLENSCGQGHFLYEIVRRYIYDCKKQGFDSQTIRDGLEHDIHGFEVDPQLIETCIIRLNELVNASCIGNVKWTIRCADALVEAKENHYQYVIGNPPYLAYPEQDIHTRDFLRKNFKSCTKGKPDYYYAFIESALKSLAEDGKMVYLVPGNFMKNYFSESLRQILLPDLCRILDYSHKQLFDGRLTSSIIVFCDRTRNASDVHYSNEFYHYHKSIPKIKMGGKWDFVLTQDMPEAKKRFGDFFHASAPVATQLNSAFVLKEWSETEDYIICGQYNIEHEVVKEAAGPNSLHYGKKEKIIFPYRLEEGSIRRFDESFFHEKYPGAYDYLSQFREQLEKRKADDNAKWFEYGRSQLLSHLDQPKLLTSAFVTGTPKTYILSRDTIPYAGLCIVAKGSYPIEKACSILQSPEFLEHVKAFGVCTNSGSYRISPRDINNFVLSENNLREMET